MDARLTRWEKGDRICKEAKYRGKRREINDRDMEIMVNTS